jgi:cobalamin biosynthesis Mg chelatase CobN
MQTAVANMTGQSDGTLLPNPQGGAVNGVEPYPLTYVEYAIAPAQPLMNSNCTVNTAAQTAMNQWLTFLVGQGQNDLPAGMAQLPSSLVSQAEVDIAKVGSAAPTCTPTAGSSASGPNATPSGTGSSATPSGTSGITPSQSSPSYPYSSATGAADGSTASGSSSGKSGGASPTASSRSAALSLAGFGTVSPDSWALPLLAVLVLTLLLPGLVLLISGRSLTEALGGLRSPAQPADAQVPPSEEGGGET